MQLQVRLRAKTYPQFDNCLCNDIFYLFRSDRVITTTRQ
jgi:hypothetical protein